PFGDLKFPFRGAGHALFVNRSDDNAGAITLRQFYNLCESRHAIFIVSRVENALAACVLKAGFHLLPFSGVKHQWQLDIGYETRRQLVHIALAVATYEVHINVEYMSTFPFLFSG